MSLFETMPQRACREVEILTGLSVLSQTTGDETYIDDGTGHGIPYSASFDTAWQSVDVRSRDDTSVEVFNLDVSKVNAVLSRRVRVARWY